MLYAYQTTRNRPGSWCKLCYIQLSDVSMSVLIQVEDIVNIC
jgi:hypothetical protein